MSLSPKRCEDLYKDHTINKKLNLSFFPPNSNIKLRRLTKTEGTTPDTTPDLKKNI